LNANGVIPDNVYDGFADFDVLRGDEESEVEDVAEQRAVDQDPERVECDPAKEKSRNICFIKLGCNELQRNVITVKIYVKLGCEELQGTILTAT
jgi:hypothetical protein